MGKRSGITPTRLCGLCRDFRRKHLGLAPELKGRDGFSLKSRRETLFSAYDSDVAICGMRHWRKCRQRCNALVTLLLRWRAQLQPAGVLPRKHPIPQTPVAPPSRPGSLMLIAGRSFSLAPLQRGEVTGNSPSFADRWRAVGIKALDRLEPPGLAFLALGFGPGDGLPVRREDQSRAGVGELDAVAGRLPDIDKEGLLDCVLVRSGLDEDAVLEKDVGGLQDVLTLVDSEGDVMKASLATGVVARISDIIALVVDREPATADCAVVEHDLLGDPAAERFRHEIAD